jgi:hypothetical protein
MYHGQTIKCIRNFAILGNFRGESQEKGLRGCGRLGKYPALRKARRWASPGLVAMRAASHEFKDFFEHFPLGHGLYS